jgi:hypothetical protein
MAPDSDEGVRFPGIFNDPATEREFRNSERRHDVLRSRAFLVAIVLAILALTYTDYDSYGFSEAFWRVAAARAAFLALSFVAMLSFERVSSPFNRDCVLVAWALCTAALVAYVASTRPPFLTGHLVFNAVVVLVVYVLLPLPVTFQVLPALVISVTSVYLGVHILGGHSTPGVRALDIAHLTANGVGLFISLQHHFSKRNLFAAFQRQSILLKEIEQALAEIKTLRGILPICAHCKKIRDDTGYWSQVEGYVKKHSHAEFTHGICPDCAEEHYKEYLSN